MIKNNRYSNSLVPTTARGINWIGWELSPEYQKRKTSTDMYLNRHYQKKKKTNCVKIRSLINLKTNYCGAGTS